MKLKELFDLGRQTALQAYVSTKDSYNCTMKLCDIELHIHAVFDWSFGHLGHCRILNENFFNIKDMMAMEMDDKNSMDVVHSPSE